MSGQLDYPSARRERVRKTIGGVTFDDPFAWLQDESAEALAWQGEQNALAEKTARSWSDYEPLREAVERHYSLSEMALGAAQRRVGGRWFTVADNQLRTGGSVHEIDRVLVDGAELAAGRDDGRPVVLAFIEPSPDGSLVAFTTMVGGDMVGEWRVVEVASGDPLDLAVPTQIFNSPRPGWLPDGSGFLLAERAGDGRHQVRFVGVDPDAEPREPVVFGFDEVPPTLPGLQVQVSPAGRRAVAVTVPHEHVALRLADLEADTWGPFLPEGFAGECHGAWLDEDTYAAIVTGDAPRGRVVAIPAVTSTDVSTWRELVPASEAVLRSLAVVQDRIVLAELDDVSLRVRLFTTDGTPAGEVPVPAHSASLLTFPPRVNPPSEEFVFNVGGFTRRPSTYRYDFEKDRLEPVGDQHAEVEGIAVAQRFATSRDGTRIPYYLVHRDEVDLTTPQPTLVHGYGGFNIALTPNFVGHLVPFLDAGGVYVQATLRGGSEYGREWYDAGRLHNKQNTFDDLRAVAEHLIETGVATPDRLAMQGASNGGLLAGVAITQQHDLWRVVVPQVPLFDMLEPTGPGESAEAIRSYYLEDYGDPDDPDDAATLFAYSPYHNVQDGVAYPAVFQVFGEKDLGCQPFHGRKFTARLQAATSSSRSVLLRVWPDVGHGSLDPDIGSHQQAEWLGFVMDQLGMALRTADTAPGSEDDEEA